MQGDFGETMTEEVEAMEVHRKESDFFSLFKTIYYVHIF